MQSSVNQLELKDVRCIRGERLLFSKLNFACEEGTLVRLAGPNGTGKTSLLRLIVGLMPPTQGEVLWGGVSIKKLKEDYWKDLVYIGHLNGVKDDLTARENLLINCNIAEHPVTKEQADKALKLVGLEGFENIRTRELSQGQRRRVALARLYEAKYARIWVLDEPFTALDVKAVENLASLIEEQVNVNKGIVVFTTHQEVPINADKSQRIDLTGGRWLSAVRQKVGE